MDNRPKLVLIDAMAIVFRAHYAMGGRFQSPLTGEPTGAVYGFASILLNILEKEKPDYCAIAFDTKEPTFRHREFPEYKANRAEFPEDLVPQLARIKDLVKAWNLPLLEVPGYEADDIIGTLAHTAAQEGCQVFCVTPDKDYFQLVSDNVQLLRPVSGGGEYTLIDIAAVKEKFGVEPEKVIDVLGLIGDTSDNIPGVKGVGEKTAIPLIQQYGSIDGIYENIGEITKKALRQKLEEHKDMAFLSKKLVTIVRDMELAASLDELRLQKPHLDGIKEVFSVLGFKTLFSRIARYAEGGDAADVAPQEDENTTSAQEAPHKEIRTLADIQHTYTLVDNEEIFQKLKQESTLWKRVAFDTETSSLDVFSCQLVGVSLAPAEGCAYYIPLNSCEANSAQQPAQKKEVPAQQFDMFGSIVAEETPPTTAEEDEHSGEASAILARNVLEWLREILANTAIEKIAQNAKFDLLVLRRYGVEKAEPLFDTMLASYVVNTDMQHGMDALALHYLSYKPIPITALLGEKKKEQISMADLSPEEIKDYAAEDADITLRLFQTLDKELKQTNQEDFARSVEFPLVSVLVQIESNGVFVDKKELAEISARLSEKIEVLKEEIHRLTGEQFNLDSPKQLAEVLFEKMGIAPLKKTKTGYSTDVAVLEELAKEHPVAASIVEYRQLAKLRSTYTDALPRLINPQTGLIHTSYNQAVTSTGRLSSTEPNLQNIPIRTEEGRLIRRAFSSRFESGSIMAADYSQIELRIMASISKDENLCQAFAEGVDVHAATAARLNEVPLDEVTGEMRRAAKAVNFGIMYGLGAFGLAQRLDISRTKGKEIIENYFTLYPRIKEYIDTTIMSATEKGYTETLSGRRRYFPDLKSKNRVARAAAERAAINMPIQGTAADMMKLAMIRLHEEMKNYTFRSVMTLQVHDELVFDIAPGEEQALSELVRKCMEEAQPLPQVPIVVEVGFGTTWGEAH